MENTLSSRNSFKSGAHFYVDLIGVHLGGEKYESYKRHIHSVLFTCNVVYWYYND